MSGEEHKGFLISHGCDMLGKAQQNNVFHPKKVTPRKLPVCRTAVDLKGKKKSNIDIIFDTFLKMLT
ncbi:hypothetical protein [Priestia megaterium]|jgi:hypothetical protein|uniref:hypothetical protein n=1 Tax=Priestia megaterium TaxID=1404 RepID=UPI001155A6E3|nr:hypothetical protein [Priestia megaterium]